jgi:hypothetical protein
MTKRFFAIILSLLLLTVPAFLTGCATTIEIDGKEVLRAYVPRGQTVTFKDVIIDNKPDAFWKTFLMTIGGNLPNVEND